MAITMDGKYRTRAGKSVRILCTDATGDQPVVGLVGDYVLRWNADGCYDPDGYDCDGNDCDEDLVEDVPSPLELAARKVCEEWGGGQSLRSEDNLLSQAIAELADAIGY